MLTREKVRRPNVDQGEERGGGLMLTRELGRGPNVNPEEGGRAYC